MTTALKACLKEVHSVRNARNLEPHVLRLLEKTLPAKRLAHVRGVMRLAESLAVRHGMSRRRVRLAAALHDVARCWDVRALQGYARKYRLKVPEFEAICSRHPVLLHSYVGADLSVVGQLGSGVG